MKSIKVDDPLIFTFWDFLHLHYLGLFMAVVLGVLVAWIFAEKVN